MTPMDSPGQALFDRTAAALGLVVMTPVLAAAVLAVLIEDGGPVLFRQTRVGRNGLPFQLLKLRSMRKANHGKRITAGNDPRVTRSGRILRKYKLDELPQLWNVIRGDMSLVGPRPEVPEFVNLSDAAWQAVVQVRPGITDLATLMYRNEEEILAQAADAEATYISEILPRKLRLNLDYMRTRTVVSDLQLIMLTIWYSFVPGAFSPARVKKLLTCKETL